MNVCFSEKNVVFAQVLLTAFSFSESQEPLLIQDFSVKKLSDDLNQIQPLAMVRSSVCDDEEPIGF